jgi:hypothetical protein
MYEIVSDGETPLQFVLKTIQHFIKQDNGLASIAKQCSLATQLTPSDT